MEDLADNGLPIPVNSKAGDDDTTVLLRKLDRAVFVNLHDLREIASEKEWAENGVPLAYPPYDMVRGAFQQGNPVAPSSAFSCHSHIQLALVNEKCVLGWFLPQGDKLLSEEELQKARLRLRSAGASRKPRVRATRDSAAR